MSSAFTVQCSPLPSEVFTFISMFHFLLTEHNKAQEKLLWVRSKVSLLQHLVFNTDAWGRSLKASQACSGAFSEYYSVFQQYVSWDFLSHNPWFYYLTGYALTSLH